MKKLINFFFYSLLCVEKWFFIEKQKSSDRKKIVIDFWVKSDFKLRGFIFQKTTYLKGISFFSLRNQSLVIISRFSWIYHKVFLKAKSSLSLFFLLPAFFYDFKFQNEGKTFISLPITFNWKKNQIKIHFCLTMVKEPL